MNQVLDVVWKGQIITRRKGEKKCGGILKFELDPSAKGARFYTIVLITHSQIFFFFQAVLLACALFAYQSQTQKH